MNPRILIDLRNILATLYPDGRSIRRVVDDAGVDSSKMDIDTHALNSWHSVLSEAEKNHQIEAILKTVEVEYGNNQTFQAAYHHYRQTISDSISKAHVDHPKTQNKPRRQRLLVSIIGLLLTGIVGSGLYWGIPGLRNLGMAISTAATIVPDTDETEAPFAVASNEVPAAPSPSINTTVVTRTQITAMPFTSTPETPTSTPTTVFTATPTSIVTPTPEPTATATPVPIPSYPCDATTTTKSSANTIRLLGSPAGGTQKETLPEGVIVQIIRKVPNTDLYEIWYIERHIGGYVNANNLNLSSLCPK